MVEILLATHNSQKYIDQLMDSLLEQTLPDIHILVSDDGSLDDTKNILNRYAKENKNVTVLKNPSVLGGAKENFFRLIEDADAEYILFADHDDVWYPDKAEKTLEVMRCMEKEKGWDVPLLVHTDLEVVDTDLKTIAPSMMKVQKLGKKFCDLNNFLPQNHVTGCTIMVNRALVKKVKYTDIKPIVMHDWWMALIASAFGGIGFLDRSTIKYRQHTENEIGAVDTRDPGYVTERLLGMETMKQRLHDTYRQAEEFYKTYGDELSEKDAQMVRAYAEFSKIGKFARWERLFKFDLFKYGFVRKIGQLLLG